MREYPHDYAIRAYHNAISSDLDHKAETYIAGDGKSVYSAFCRYTWELIFAGQKKIGAKSIAERIRWDHMTRKPDGAEFLVNNNYVAFMARKFMKDNPQVGEIFETRERKV